MAAQGRIARRAGRGARDTGGYAPILFSTKLRSYLSSQKHPPLQIKDVDKTAPRANVPQSPLPRLIIAEGAGKLIYQCPLPKTVDEVIETIKAHGG